MERKVSGRRNAGPRRSPATEARSPPHRYNQEDTFTTSWGHLVSLHTKVIHSGMIDTDDNWALSLAESSTRPQGVLISAREGQRRGVFLPSRCVIDQAPLSAAFGNRVDLYEEDI